jgi:hypothetical protein
VSLAGLAEKAREARQRGLTSHARAFVMIAQDPV